jgi:hypothetical protein
MGVLRLNLRILTFLALAATALSAAPARADLLVGSHFNSSVKRYNETTGAFLDTFVTSGSGGLSGSTSAVFGPDGNLYVSSQPDHILRWTSTPWSAARR